MLEGLRNSWNDFFFRPIDPRPIGIYRILFGALVLISGLMVWPDLLTWYGEKGVLSLETARRLTSMPRFDLLAILPSGDRWVWGFYLVHLLAALFLMLGLFTRVSAIVVFLTLVSFDHRNSTILNSGDTLLRVISFFVIFSQAGAAYSLDWAWKAVRGKGPVRPQAAKPWAQRMIQLQLSMVYVFTVMWKLQGATWRDGTAVYYASRLEEFQRFPVPWAFENLILLKLITWSTLLVELLMGTLVWVPHLRARILALGLMLHLGLEYSMNIPLFQWIMMSTFVLFVEPRQIRVGSEKLRQVLRMEAKPPVPVFYDGNCAFCVRTTRILHQVDLLGKLRFVNFREPSALTGYSDFDSARAEREMALFTRASEWRFGYDAFKFMAWRIPLLWPVAWISLLPGVGFAGRRVYAWVSAHRYLIMGEVCTEGTCLMPVRTELPEAHPGASAG